jgi:CspA family cold shock protein
MGPLESGRSGAPAHTETLLIPRSRIEDASARDFVHDDLGVAVSSTRRVGGADLFAVARTAADSIRVDQRAMAIRTVAGHALDVDDCRELLSMLGLSDPGTAATQSPMHKEQHHMSKGTIKWFNGAKGFGFITPEAGGKDLFVHKSHIDGYESNGIADNLPVEFEVSEGRNGPEATSVRLV